jgi:hypothetical protein
MSASYTTASRSNSFTNGEQLTVAAGSPTSAHYDPPRRGRRPGDQQLESTAPLELVVATARLWRSLGHHDAESRFRIDRVTGHDEYMALTVGVERLRADGPVPRTFLPADGARRKRHTREPGLARAGLRQVDRRVVPGKCGARGRQRDVFQHGQSESLHVPERVPVVPTAGQPVGGNRPAAPPAPLPARRETRRSAPPAAARDRPRAGCPCAPTNRRGTHAAPGATQPNPAASPRRATSRPARAGRSPSGPRAETARRSGRAVPGPGTKSRSVWQLQAVGLPRDRMPPRDVAGWSRSPARTC